MTNEAVSRLRLGDDTARFERAWKFEKIEAALKHPKGSAARKAEIDKLDGQSFLDWTGHKRTLTQSTLYSWIGTYEAEGIHALAQRVRRDKGSKKVFISRAWSKTVPFDDETKGHIEHEIKQFIRGCIAKGTARKLIRIFAGKELQRITAAYGFILNDHTKVDRVFGIPHDLISAESRFKAVYRHNFDRKASEDNKPRIRRTINGLEPMEIVVMDVHHMNVYVRREDGTTATPKLLAFYDVATARVFCEIIFFNERGGVRNVDVIEAFKNMCQHPSFGMPQYLYADNGSEYGFADYLEDALRLNCRGIASLDDLDKETRNRVIRAIPYNAAAKVVEGWFRQMNQAYFRHIPGWVDDDRFNPKRKELGKPMPPFDGDFSVFSETVFDIIGAYEAIPQQGALKGKSPAKVFQGLVEAGWAATVVNEQDFYLAFSKPETRDLRKHSFSLGGRNWTSPGLDRCFESKIVVQVPKYHGFNEVLVKTLGGEVIGWAMPDRPFSYLDQRGAETSAQRGSDRNKGLRDMQKSIPDIDVGAKLIEIGREEGPVIPNTPSGYLSVSFGGSPESAIVPARGQQKSEEETAAEQQEIDDARSAFANALSAGRRTS